MMLAGVTRFREAPPMLPVRYRVTDRRQELPDTVTITVEAVDQPLAVARPGQFHMMWVFGVGEVPISVAGHDELGRVEHTIRSVGAVTTALCAAEPGTMIGVRGPFGSCFDLDATGERDLLVLAGGIGLAPVRPVVLEAMRSPHRFRRVTVLTGAKSPASVLYAGEVDRWRRAGAHVSVIVDAAAPGWSGPVGLVTQLIPRALVDPKHTTVVMCGPEIMMCVAARDLIGLGVPGEAVQVSLERNMQCAVRQCGRCQLGPHFVCHDGPVFTWPQVAELLEVPDR